jgi:hypothetical protein
VHANAAGVCVGRDRRGVRAGHEMLILALQFIVLHSDGRGFPSSSVG